MAALAGDLRPALGAVTPMHVDERLHRRGRSVGLIRGKALGSLGRCMASEARIVMRMVRMSQGEGGEAMAALRPVLQPVKQSG